MFPSMGGGEHWLIVAVILLLVVQPKDLPKTLREIGRWVGKVRAMANEFRVSLEDMARQSELDELRAEVEAMRASTNLSGEQAAFEASHVQADAAVNGDIPYQPEPVFETPPPPSEPAKPKRARAAKPAAEAAAEPTKPRPTTPRRKPAAKAKSE